MSVEKKYKRKIIVKGKSYLWVVKENYDDAGHSLNVFSSDKKFMISYKLGQSDVYKLRLVEKTENANPPFLIVKGEQFGGVEKLGVWKRIRTPIWENDSIMTPKFVRQLIEWALDEHKEIILVNYLGFSLSPISFS